MMTPKSNNKLKHVFFSTPDNNNKNLNYKSDRSPNYIKLTKSKPNQIYKPKGKDFINY